MDDLTETASARFLSHPATRKGSLPEIPFVFSRIFLLPFIQELYLRFQIGIPWSVLRIYFEWSSNGRFSAINPVVLFGLHQHNLE